MELINSKIPKTGIKTYVEPFSGSFATFLEDDSLNFETVIYNDKNRHQVNLMKCCSNPVEFIPYLEELKSTLLHTTEAEPLKKWDFYKKIYKQDRLKLQGLIDKLNKNKYTQKLQSITEFLNIDFEELILKYDLEETYLYLDPPYARFDSDKGEDDAKRLFWYGSDADGVFGPASHRRLLELIKSSKSRWSLSYYYFPLLEELLPKDKYIWTEKEVFRSSAHGGNNSSNKKEQSKGVELLILNYDPKTGEKL